MSSFNFDQVLQNKLPELSGSGESAVDRIKNAVKSGKSEGSDVFSSMLNGIRKRMSNEGNDGRAFAVRQIQERISSSVKERSVSEKQNRIERIKEEREEEEKQKVRDRADRLEEERLSEEKRMFLDGVFSVSAGLTSGDADRVNKSSGTTAGSGSSFSAGENMHAQLSAAEKTNNEVKGYASADADSDGAKAAERMTLISDESSDLTKELNRIGTENLSKIGDEKVQSTSERISAMGGKELKSTLDSLAEESNVSKLRLKMNNPETEAAARRRESSIAALTDPAAASGTLSKAYTAPVSGSLAAAQSVLSGHVSAARLTADALQSMVYPGATESSSLSATQALLSGRAEPLTSLNVFGEAVNTEVQSKNTAITSSGSTTAALNVLRAGSGSEVSYKIGFNPLDYVSQSERRNAERVFIAQTEVLSGEDAADLAESQGINANRSAAEAAAAAGRETVMQKSAVENAALNAAAAPQIAAEIREKVMQMSARNLKTLSVELHPENMGRMEIFIELNGDNEALNVSLGAADASSRALLSMAVSDLKTTLAQDNITADDRIYDISDLRDREEQMFSTLTEEEKAANAEKESILLRKSLGLSSVPLQSAENRLKDSLYGATSYERRLKDGLS